MSPRDFVQKPLVIFKNIYYIYFLKMLLRKTIICLRRGRGRGSKYSDDNEVLGACTSGAWTLNIYIYIYIYMKAVARIRQHTPPPRPCSTITILLWTVKGSNIVYVDALIICICNVSHMKAFFFPTPHKFFCFGDFTDDGRFFLTKLRIPTDGIALAKALMFFNKKTNIFLL